MSKAFFNPPDGKLWVIPDPPKAMVGKIHLPNQERGKQPPSHYLCGMATVKAIGPGRWSQDGTRRLPMPCKVDDRVLCFFQQQNQFRPEDITKETWIIDDDQVMAVVDGIPDPTVCDAGAILQSN